MQDELQSYLKHQEKKDDFWWTIEFSTPTSDKSMARNEEVLSTVAALSDSLGAFIFTENDENGRKKLFLRAAQRKLVMR